MPVTEYIWDVENDSYLMETYETGTTTATYTNEPSQFGGLISQRRDGQSSYYHYDALGSTRELTDETETRTDTYVYSGFGETVAESGTTENPFGYVGQYGYYFDSHADTYYIRRRIYQPAIVRWTSFDPIGLRDTFNAYKYARNSPLNSTDPSGLACRVCFKAVKLIEEYTEPYDPEIEMCIYKFVEDPSHDKNRDLIAGHRRTCCRKLVRTCHDVPKPLVRIMGVKPVDPFFGSPYCPVAKKIAPQCIGINGLDCSNRISLKECLDKCDSDTDKVEFICKHLKGVWKKICKISVEGSEDLCRAYCHMSTAEFMED